MACAAKASCLSGRLSSNVRRHENDASCPRDAQDTGRRVPNRWNIPAALELEVEARDQACIYCGVSFASATRRGQRRSWEHIVNDARLVSRENIALCCISCNASKGTKSLAVWLETGYCQSRGIRAGTVAPVAQAALQAAGSAERAA